MHTLLDSKTGPARVYRNVSPEAVVTECNEDFILPDYLPEIRKFLRLDAVCIPSGSFVGADAAEFGGRVAYTLYYADAEGHPTAVPLHSDYEYRVPLSEGEVCAVSTHDTVESAACRPSGPRKISVRTRVRGVPRVYTAAEAQEDLSTLVPPDAGEVECLRCQRKTARRVSITSGELAAEVSLSLDGVSAEGIRLLDTRCTILPESARAEEGRVLCRGTLFFRLLAEREGVPFSEVRRVPFEAELTSRDVCAEDTITLRCYTGQTEGQLRPTESGAEILLDTTYTVWADCGRNEEVALVTDMYATAYPLTIHTKPLRTERLMGGVMALFTVDGSAPCRDEGEEGEVLDTAVTVLSSDLTLLPRRIIVNGEMRGAMLFARMEGGCGACDFTFPFRLEAELPREVSAEDVCEYTVTPVFAEGKLDRGVCSCSVEVALNATVLHREEDAVPVRTERKEGEMYERTDMYRIYYPCDGETLWQIAKKYGVPLSLLCKENEIPEEDMAAADERQSIDGYPRLCIPEL